MCGSLLKYDAVSFSIKNCKVLSGRVFLLLSEMRFPESKHIEINL